MRQQFVAVDWNPFPGTSLTRVLSKPFETPYLTLRIITVPPHVHKLTPYSDFFTVQQWLGKNVGIRRARGEFILSTTGDMLYSEELFGILSRRSLHPERYYRLDRLNLNESIPEDLKVWEMDKNKKWLRSHVSGVYLWTDFVDLEKSPELIEQYVEWTRIIFFFWPAFRFL
jgi:hypothetical protein